MKILGRLWIIFTIALVFGCEFGEEENSDSKNSLTEGEWTDGKISKDGLIKKYTFTVSEWTRYFIFMNNAWNGDDKKSAYTGIKISHSDGTIISSSYGSVTSCYTKPLTFVSANSGTVTMIMACSSSSSGWSNDWGKGIGTYAIKYNSRPEYITLSENEWHEDDILTNDHTNKYYISVTEGTRYNIYINDAWNGDGTKKAYIGLTIKYTQDSNASNPTICSSYSNAMKLYDKPYTFTASGTGTIIITAACNSSSSGRFSDWEKGTGTYAIRILSVTD